MLLTHPYAPHRQFYSGSFLPQSVSFSPVTYICRGCFWGVSWVFPPLQHGVGYGVSPCSIIIILRASEEASPPPYPQGKRKKYIYGFLFIPLYGDHPPMIYFCCITSFIFPGRGNHMGGWDPVVVCVVGHISPTHKSTTFSPLHSSPREITASYPPRGVDVSLSAQLPNQILGIT